jgi:hypothetical protein
MRKTEFWLIAYAAVALAVASPAPVHAQIGGGGGGGGGGGQDEEDEKAKKRKEEWGTDSNKLALPALRNAGPCPMVKVLYDAARYVELKNNEESASAVGFTGEIDDLTSACEYKADEPIKVQAQVLFDLGRGPQAQGEHKTYRYWVAVTDRDKAVIEKEYFDLPVTFPAGHDRVRTTEKVYGITIPRAAPTVSGANFEVLVGFDVTPAMAEFNHDGKRFLENAGVARAASVAKP